MPKLFVRQDEEQEWPIERCGRLSPHDPHKWGVDALALVRWCEGRSVHAYCMIGRGE